jgi:hypothetical protein
MNASFIIYPQQAASLALTKMCEIDGTRYLLKNRYRNLNDLEKENKDQNLIIGQGRFFYYVLEQDKK